MKMPNNIFNARAEEKVSQVCLAVRSQQHDVVPQKPFCFWLLMTARMDDMGERNEDCGLHGAGLRQRVELEFNACIFKNKSIWVFPNCSHADCATTPRHVLKCMFPKKKSS